MSRETNTQRRTRRNRFNLKQRSNGRPRLSVFRSAKHIYAQVIDDSTGKTLAAASSLDKAFEGKACGNVDAAKKVGDLVAKLALKAKIEQVVFDRGAYLYHGRVQALAEAARQAGLKF